MVFLIEFFEKVDFENNQQMTKKNMKNFPGGKKYHPLAGLVLWTGPDIISSIHCTCILLFSSDFASF